MAEGIGNAALDAEEQAADRAAAAGDVTAARAMLERVVAQAPERIDTWLKLAAVRRATGAIEGALGAISSALRIDPLHFVALLSQARMDEAAGRTREAGRGYARALAQTPDGEAVPASLKPLVDHAHRASEAYKDGIAADWDRAIATGADLSANETRRLERFKTNALRRTRVYHSEPTQYHYPGLVEREFHEREDFAWLPEFERATADIHREATALMQAERAKAEPYIRYGDDVPLRQWEALNQSMDWTAFHLTQAGRTITENAALCPATMAALARIDQPHIANRSPNAMFSLLRPHTHIPPHTGVANTRLVCHLPLIVPEKCWFRVGGERREWVVGEAFIFDDTIEHEAANESEEPRVVLIIDLWHPGLSGGERDAVKRLMEADETDDGAPL